MLGKSPSCSFMVHRMTRSAEVLSAAGNNKPRILEMHKVYKHFSIVYLGYNQRGDRASLPRL